MVSRLCYMAGAEGFEPSTKVLETHVLPLHHAPGSQRIGLYGEIREMSSIFDEVVHHDPGSDGGIQRFGTATHGKTETMGGFCFNRV